MKKRKYPKIDSIEVLGTDYQIDFRTEDEDAALENCLGYCDKYLKLIVVSDEMKAESEELGGQWIDSFAALQKKVIRHELTHAFLTECGLSEASQDQWANNEEVIDFLALNAKKLVDLFEEAGVL